MKDYVFPFSITLISQIRLPLSQGRKKLSMGKKETMEMGAESFMSSGPAH